MKIKLAVILITLTALFTYLVLPPTPPLSPRGTLTSPLDHSQKSSFIILGFAPYWNLKKLDLHALNSITHFAYFALHLDVNGNIQTHVNRRELEPGYLNYTRLLQENPADKPLILTFMPENQDALAAILTSPAAGAAAVTAITDKVKEISASGVNVDFEPLGDIPPALRDGYTQFVRTLRQTLGSVELSVSIYPSAATRPRIWDLANLAPYTDYFVVMTYDYTMPSADRVGPNSPLRGAGQLFEHDIVKNIAEISRLVAPSKLLLGIPFYGYEWDTVTADKYSTVEGRGSVASLARINQMIEDKTLELVWDRNTLTPYGISSVSGQTSQIYFENNTSIKLKLDFVKSAGLGGIAIWALGYEGNNPTLWDTITSLNR